tara:strand:- start:245 stop:403 length:159 start_codon:yes stop_codon:yes gene_type:complete
VNAVGKGKNADGVANLQLKRRETAERWVVNNGREMVCKGRGILAIDIGVTGS